MPKTNRTHPEKSVKLDPDLYLAEQEDRKKAHSHPQNAVKNSFTVVDWEAKIKRDLNIITLSPGRFLQYLRSQS